MNSKLVGLMMAFFIGQIISYIVELNTLGSYQLTTFYQLMHPQIASTTTTAGIVVGFLNTCAVWVKALIDMLAWNYAFFQGYLIIVKYALCIPLTIGFIWAIVTLIRGGE